MAAERDAARPPLLALVVDLIVEAVIADLGRLDRRKSHILIQPAFGDGGKFGIFAAVAQHIFPFDTGASSAWAAYPCGSWPQP